MALSIVERSCDIKLEMLELDIASSKKKGVLSSTLDEYRNHPSHVKTRENRNFQFNSISIPSSSCGSRRTSKEIKTILKSLNSKKAPSIDKIPTKLVKLASGVLTKSLSKAINNSISTFTFPNNARIVPVYLLTRKLMINM